MCTVVGRKADEDRDRERDGWRRKGEYLDLSIKAQKRLCIFSGVLTERRAEIIVQSICVHLLCNLFFPFFSTYT